MTKLMMWNTWIYKQSQKFPIFGITLRTIGVIRDAFQEMRQANSAEALCDCNVS